MIEAQKKRSVLALTYRPHKLICEYCQRWGVSRLCSGREELVPPRTKDQNTTLFTAPICFLCKNTWYMLKRCYSLASEENSSVMS